jgi:hypothetical protein
MRSFSALAFVFLLGIATTAPAARAVARATIVVPAEVSSAAAIASPSVSIESVREGDYVYVTIAFN